MCNSCRQDCRGIRFDFQCKKFYHDYCASSSYIKPDFICFFNPVLHRPGFRGFDTWPKTVQSAINASVPVLITSCTEKESILDFQKIEKLAGDVEIIVKPQKNPYASTKPERNFYLVETEHVMFKNQFYFIVRGQPDLIKF